MFVQICAVRVRLEGDNRLSNCLIDLRQALLQHPDRIVVQDISAGLEPTFEIFYEQGVTDWITRDCGADKRGAR